MGNLMANDVLLVIALLPVMVGFVVIEIADWRNIHKAKKDLAQAIRSGDEGDIVVARIMLKGKIYGRWGTLL